MPTTIFSGYDPDFLSTRHSVPLPRLTARQQADRVAAPDHPDGLLHQANYTVALNASRRLAWYSAANVDATRFQPVTRKELTNYWRRGNTLPAETMTTGRWYRLSEKKLQRGHLTPADCMEWGSDPAEAIRNANTTFHYSNAVPQMQRLNGREWGRARPQGPFEELGSYKTYQVGVGSLQRLTGLKYAAAQREPYAGDRPVELMLQEIDVPVPDGEEDAAPRGLLPLGKKSQRVLMGLSL